MPPVRVQNAKDNERILSRVYEKLYSQIINNPAYPFDIITLKKLFNDKVYVATRKAIEETYKEGIRYTGNKLKTDTYITQTDIDNIKKATDKAVNQFWGRIQNDMNRTNEQKTAEFIGTKPKDDLSTSAVLKAIPTIALFSTLALSAISKVKQIKSKSQPQIIPPSLNQTLQGQTLLGISAGLADIGPIGEEIFTTDEAIGEGSVKYEWVTAGDENVCPICEELDGEIFDSEDDADLIIPGELGDNGSHPNCRCYLEIVTE